MIYPMMLKIDFASIRGVGKRPGGLAVTLVVNWLVKPFSMAFLGWLFFRHVFTPWIGPELASEYIAGVIILAAAPCTAMVFVWSYLSDGDPAYTLVQVAVNDLIMLVAFAPIVKFLVAGASGLQVPFAVLLYSVLIFVVIPLAAGSISRSVLIRRKGADWFAERFLPVFQPVTVIALLLTLVAIFAFQAENITTRAFHVVLIAIPILIQVYFNSGLAYGLMRLFRIPYGVAAPGALIGASNFFELAVATAIALYGPGSGAALATVVGVLVEVPVMLSVCRFCVAHARLVRGPAAVPARWPEEPPMSWRPRRPSSQPPPTRPGGMRSVRALAPPAARRRRAWWLVYSRLAAVASWLTLRGAAALVARPPLGSAVEFFLYEAPKVLMLLTLVVFGVGIVRSFFTPERTRRVLAGKREAVGSVLAALLGVVTPFCSCSAVPLFIGFVTTGVPLGVTFSFLVSAPMVNEIALALLFGLFGWKVAALYAGTGLAIAVVSGLVIGRLHLEGWVEPWVYRVKAGAGRPGAKSASPGPAGWPRAARRCGTSSAGSGRTSSAGSRSARASTATCRRTSWRRSWGATPGGRCRSPS